MALNLVQRQWKLEFSSKSPRTADFPNVSIITMLAPSPDWFIGIDSLDLCNSGKWRKSVNVAMLPPWDAGKEDQKERMFDR